MAVVKDGSASNGKLIAAGLTLESITIFNFGNLRGFTTWTHCTVWPAEFFKVIVTGFLAMEFIH